MTKLQKLEASIERLRKEMHGRIRRQDNLLSPEIIDISQRLDKLLNEYEKEAVRTKLTSLSRTFSITF
jgi:hypothetical protein